MACGSFMYEIYELSMNIYEIYDYEGYLMFSIMESFSKFHNPNLGLG